ncbi:MULTISPECIES: cytochrome b/b6 domain-containing protein [Sphingobium]|uniref:cytochrome b/b6 domain-containing protein n=1 Tax=Sphingobium sp. MI1205 TaxID=407020 RepID=UPI0007700FDC|nr:cytochrome b/b6 domain-containing protein [Sphingobium sp. MI1205]AMK17258.1 cytochrome b561 [Sphingobium sp. MI1205]
MTSETSRPHRWDPVVKLTHWSIVLAVLANAIVTEEGSSVHIWVGYALAAILALRLLWGLIGPGEARFTAFPFSPSRALAHIREIRGGRKSEHPSHNPLGALMVYAIWSCLLVIIVTGIAMAGLPGTSERHGEAGAASESYSKSIDVREATEQDDRDEGADLRSGGERKEGGEEGEEGPLAEIHETAANLLYVLILLHIAGVIFETRRRGRQVVLAMLPGHR